MGLLKKVVQVISAPVTVPLKVASNIADNTGIGGPVSSLSSLAAAPFELLQKGTSFSEVLNQAKPGLSLLSTAAGGPLAGGLGMDLGAFGKLLPDPGAPLSLEGAPAPTGGGGVYKIQESPAPVNMLPYIAIGSAVLVLVIVLAKRR